MLEATNLVLGFASFAMSVAAFRKATTVGEAVSRFHKKMRRLELYHGIRDALASTRELMNSTGRSLSQGRCDALRQQLVMLSVSPDIDKSAKRTLRFAIAQIRQAPDNTQEVKIKLRELEEDLIDLANHFRDHVEEDL